MNRPATRGRRGHTLIELMVTMSAAVVVLTLSVTCVHRMMSISSHSSRILQAEKTALQLSRQFRYDALLASSASVTSKPGDEVTTVVLLKNAAGPGVDVEYRLTPARAVRISSAESGVPTREEYQLPEGTRWHASWDEAGKRVTLVATNPPLRMDLEEQGPPAVWLVPFEMDLTATVGRLNATRRDSSDDTERDATE